MSQICLEFCASAMVEKNVFGMQIAVAFALINTIVEESPKIDNNFKLLLLSYLRRRKVEDLSQEIFQHQMQQNTEYLLFYTGQGIPKMMPLKKNKSICEIASSLFQLAF